MEKVKVYVDRVGRTLSVWFGDPSREHICEEIADDVILMKDVSGRVIGFEQLNYLPRKTRRMAKVPVSVELV